MVEREIPSNATSEINFVREGDCIQTTKSQQSGQLDKAQWNMRSDLKKKRVSPDHSTPRHSILV